MKHIIFSTFDDYTSKERGGTAMAVHNHAKRFSKKYSVSVIVAKRQLSHDTVIDGVIYKHIGISFGDMRLRQIIYLFLLPFHVIFQRYDIWIEAFTGPISTAFLPLFTSKPVIGATHFFNGDEMRRKYMLPFDWIEKIGIKTFKYLIVLSEFQKEKAIKMNPHLDIRIIPNGVNENLFYLRRTSEKTNQLLFLGRIDLYTKGLDLLPQVMKILVRDSYDIKLAVCGKGGAKDEAALMEKINFLGLRDNILLKGYVEKKEKISCIKNCLILLAPSRFENFGGAILEAMASGCPIVVFNLPCHSWIPNDCVVRVHPFDVGEYSKAVKYLIDHTKEREAIGRRARKFAKNFSWDESARIYQEYIEEIIR